MNEAKHIVWPTIFIFLVTTIGVSAALQGWNSRTINFDLLPYIDDAHKFITLGQVPGKGTLTSFGSYTPPGITWLMIPGTAIFSDPRLFESLGCALLYIGTLIGIFLLARAYFGTACAYLAVGLWGLSELGLLFAQSSWARSHPFFYVWMVYWLDKWVERNNTWYLVASITTWAVGMYVFLEMAPALFIVPIVWVVYRPSTQLAPLFVAAVVIAIVWYPYLRFESKRNFVDLKSQVLRQNVRPTNFKDFWCNPVLVPKSWETESAASNAESDRNAGSPNSGWTEAVRHMRPFLERAALISSLLLIANFNHIAKIPGTSVLLVLITFTGLLFVSARGLGFLFTKAIINNFQISWPVALKWLGIATMLCGLLINEFTVARYLSGDGILEPSTLTTIRKLQLLLVIGALLLVMLRHPISKSLHRLISSSNSEDARRPRRVGVFAISLIVPWMVLLLMTEADRLERFWWLWPLQILTLAAVVTYLPSQFGFSRAFAWIGSIILIFIVVGNSLLLSRLRAWVSDGWAGGDRDLIKVVDYTGREIRTSGNQTAAIGYQPYIYRFMATFHGIDSRYKVGAEFDLLFKYRHGIVNTNRCAEGVSSEDKYRIVQTSTNATDEAARQYIDIPRDDRFYLSRQFGSYQVFQRQ